MTLDTLLSHMTEALKMANISSPGVEARAMLCAARGICYDDYFSFARADASPELCGKAETMIKRRLEGTPAAYLCGTWEFYGLEFSVAPGVLIPRADTETLIDTARRRVKKPDRILDLCTGSGCIGITLSRLSGGEVTLSDLSPEALKICALNASVLLSPGSYQIELRDARSRRREQGHFDLVVSNPPYVTEKEYGHLDPEVRLHEPKMALVAEREGMMFYETIPEAVFDCLKPGGVLAFECGITQSKAVGECLALAGYTDIEYDRDTGGILRVVSARKPLKTLENNPTERKC